METPQLQGQKRSKLYFNKIDIFQDRIETKALLMPKKTILRNDIISWTEVNKKQPRASLNWSEFTVYTVKTKFTISTLHWANYKEMKALLSAGKQRDTEKEAKIYGR